MAKNLPAEARDAGSISGSGRSPEGGNGNPSNILAWKIPLVSIGRLISEFILFQVDHFKSLYSILFFFFTNGLLLFYILVSLAMRHMGS